MFYGAKCESLRFKLLGDDELGWRLWVPSLNLLRSAGQAEIVMWRFLANDPNYAHLFDDAGFFCSSLGQSADVSPTHSGLG